MIIALQTLVFFRESLLTALGGLLRPYYNKFALTYFSRQVEDDEVEDEEVFAEFDDEKGVVFYPPVYAQRYAAVSDCLMDERWCGKLEKVVDLGFHDMSFIKYLKEVQGVQRILGVDIEAVPLRCSSDLVGCEDYAPKKDSPLQITLFEGNAADPDYRLIGCDAVVGIEMIEHMLPHDLERLVHTVFGFVKPWIVIFTTPNADFNVLFKALEKNGLRRWDHFFEWTREQFHDWCSNIVARYPQYTVSCKGIGPGPPGTLHYGCCSQLALFVNKDYQKQQDLDINSLAMVANVPSPHNMSEMMTGWESPLLENNMICQHNNADVSLTELIYSEKQSCVTILITSPGFSQDNLQHSDKTSQCNLDSEIGRNFIMFDDEAMCLTVLVPRRKMDTRVYEIEDVNSRLNCTTCQVKKFSKTTHNLMARNKIDSLVHTREVVAEIRHLSKMLNLNQRSLEVDANAHQIWCNINWGDNTPYWNQFYKIVREYNYPFETKSEDCRILELVSDEVNRLLDAQYDGEVAVDVGKLEVPIDHLMRVVRHVTDDVDKVKDLLEWNGYEVVDNVVIHTRLVVDNASMVSRDDDWLEDDTISDWDNTDVHSTSLSDGSTVIPDYHGRCLRRALDRKVRKLRNMLSADEDISTELDRVVCRLMKLALRSSKGKETPPPARWMQCKLLDLLTLTEKSIARRKRHYIESFPLKAIDYTQDASAALLTLSKIEDDKRVREIVDKYQHLILVTDTNPHPIEFGLEYFMTEDDFPLSEDKEEHLTGNYPIEDNSVFVDVPQENLDVAKSVVYDIEPDNIPRDEEVTDFEYNMPDIQNISESYPSPNGRVYKPVNMNVGLYSDTDRTQAWVEEENNVVLVPYASFDDKSVAFSSSDHGTSYGVRCTYNKGKKCKTFTKHFHGLNVKSCKTFGDKRSRIKQNKNKGKSSNSKLHKQSSSSFGTHKHVATIPSDYENDKAKDRRRLKSHKKIKSTASKPIPSSIIEFCHPELYTQKITDEFQYHKIDNNVKSYNAMDHTNIPNIAATEASLLVDIIMGDMEETIALRRTIGTHFDSDHSLFEREIFLERNVERNDSLQNQLIATDNVQSQTIFLYDINEPSTSKGVRHVSMDVQCGSDTVTHACAMPTPAPSLARLPKMFSNGIKIEDSITNISSRNYCSVFSTPMKNNDIDIFGPSYHKIKSRYEMEAGIIIRDSLTDVTIEKISSDFGTSTDNNNDNLNAFLKLSNLLKSDVGIGDSAIDIRKRKSCDVSTIVDGEHDIIRSHSNNEHHAGIKNGASVTNLKQKVSDFGVNTEDHSYQYRSLSPPVKAFRIKSKTSDTQTTCFLPSSYASTTETRLLKPISSKMVNDSCSEFYGNSEKSAIHFTNSLRNTSLLQFNTSLTRYFEEERFLTDNNVRAKLSCGGVHIHSYREKLASEDIVYQGEWQKHKLKTHTRKKTVVSPNLSDKRVVSVAKKRKGNVKEKIPVKTQEKRMIKIEQVRNLKIIKIKQESSNGMPLQPETKKTPVSKSVLKVFKPNKILPKVNSNKIINSTTSRNTKSTRYIIRPSVIPPPVVKKDCDKHSGKSYIPLYLRKTKLNTDKDKLNQSLDSVKTIIKINKTKENVPQLIRSKTVEIKTDIIQFRKEHHENISYVVFRNDVEKKSSPTDSQAIDSTSKRNSVNMRSSSPASQTSSTCSTPDSIATVKALSPQSKSSNRNHSTSSNKSSLGNTESESTKPFRGRKIANRSKVYQKPLEKELDNKENIPESSKKSHKAFLKTDKSAFVGHKKNIFMAQFAPENSPTVNNMTKNTAQTPNKSSFRIPTVDDKKDKKLHTTAVISRRRSLKFIDSSSTEKKSVENLFHSFLNDNQVTISNKDLATKQENILLSTATEKEKATNILDDNLLSKWFVRESKDSLENTESTILSNMRQLVEERLDCIGRSSTNIIKMNSTIVSKICEDVEKSKCDESFSSVSSFQTASELLNCTLKSVLNNDENFTLGDEFQTSMLEVTPTATDIDLISFKSITSTPKYSDYSLADKIINDSQEQIQTTSHTPAARTVSIRGIYERKDQQMISNAAGILAAQAFSGFSMNAEPLVGDQPDYVNLVDSETGSLAWEVARQATSEELFVSGRSSESYESCLIDDDSDAVVPDWLFHIISQQLADPEDEQQQQMLPMPMGDPGFDVNGNALEPGVGVAVGAGDGRGIHSDHSQDSSGRGTSLDSSDTSSGPQSEAVLSDPSTITGQFQLLHDEVSSSSALAALECVDGAQINAEGENESEAVSTSRNNTSWTPRNRLLVSSDGEADISSLETDVADSSNNSLQ